MLGSFKGSRVVDRVLAGHPAAAAGIKPGDQIEVIDRHPVTPDTLATRINATHGKPFTIVILRKGHRITIGPLRARLDQGVYRIGIQAKGLPAPGDSFPTACWHAVRIVGVFTSETVKSLAGLFVGHGTRNVSSAVGIVRVTSQAFKQSFQDFIGIVAEINLALALLNLLPVLPLDGGHIVISIIERIRRRPFSQLAYMRYSAIGLSLFIFLLYLGLRNDFSPGHS
jgi:regulator of sigma E protease